MNLNEFHSGFYLLLLYSHGIFFFVVFCFVIFSVFILFIMNFVRMPVILCKYTSFANHKSIRYLTPLLRCYVLLFFLSFIDHPCAAFFKFTGKKSHVILIWKEKCREKRKKIKCECEYLSNGRWPKYKRSLLRHLNVCMNAKHYWQLIIVVFF